MAPLIISKETMAQKRFNSKSSMRSEVFRGKMKENVDSAHSERVFSSDISMSSPAWEGTKGYNDHWNKIDDVLSKIKKNGLKQNTAQLDSDYYSLINLVEMDLTRRRMQEVDLTEVVSREIVNANFSLSVALKEFLDPVGVFKSNDLTGESVPLMQYNTGAKGSVLMEGYALGSVRSLASILYDLDIYSIQRENAAFMRAFIAKRNDLVMSPIVGATYVAAQTQAAVSTSGQTIDENIYATLLAAYKKLAALYDFQTGQEIDFSKVVVGLSSNADMFSVGRVISGQLDNSKGLTANRRALPIDELFKYNGDSVVYNKQKVSFAGIAANTGYMFVPGMDTAPHWTLTKRGLTTEIGSGSVLQLAQEETAKYFIQNSYYDEFLGASSGNAVITAADNPCGYIVKFTLPT